MRVAIIGAGFAGIGAALRLREAGIDSVAVLERSDRVGGTWRDNRYPGVACDIPAHLYCFSFLPNSGFTRRFAAGDEIQEYLERAADPIRDVLQLGTEVVDVSWDEWGARWSVATDRGTVTAAAVVLACGRLTEPRLPEVPGKFGGPVVHSARWDEALDLTGRRVALVGSGASAVQLLPHVADQASSVVVLQRSAPWVLPRGDRAHDEVQRRRWAERPELLARLRAELFEEAEAGHAARVGDTVARAELCARAQRHRRDQVEDERLRRLLTPDHEIGCKRVLFSDDYYPALSRPNVRLAAAALAGYERDAVLDGNGSRHEVDTVLLATGFEAARQPYARLVRGRGGVSLERRWADGMQAYGSIAVHGFPNLFVLDGPNASLGHNSAVIMIEAQINHVVGALGEVGPGGLIEVDVEAERRYAEEMARRSVQTVWTSGCSSWYLDPGSGRQVMLWPGTATEYVERFGHFDAAAYALVAHT
ncbi:flavin-containing monooxygenase [Nocardioides alkalitolerans]|uniref:flavin-containing monooxygenase n=1 Tax=Nocardioides alkalitolerans TaxID=281714 RepID=UPI000422C678|nr:NAD(P)/FAD-dependent oxidoreductase [Nocardioides alkalitolerans]